MNTKTAAKYHGRTVQLNKPMKGDVKKFKVYVRDPKSGNIKKVNFGDPNMEIKRDNPKRRKNFRSRHRCENPGPKTKARYWSCRMWSSKPVSKIVGSQNATVKKANNFESIKNRRITRANLLKTI